MKQQTRERLDKAAIDLRSAKVLFDAGLTDPTCFHCQQSAEKYIKAVLEEYDQAVPITHDLLTLIDLISPYLSVTDSARDAAAALSVYAIEIRYPGTDVELDDAKDAITKAEELQQWILSYIL